MSFAIQGFLAGSGGAFASIFAKLAFSSDKDICPSGVASIYVCSLLRIVFILGMFASNSVMITFFTKSMHSSSSFHATVASTAFNFSISAIVSSFLFGELLPLQWWMGFCFITCGLSILCSNPFHVKKDE
mmetsp:Transcript_22879/g.62064  ORF Transcript_22879/g.62064 Transcript_22879/m.62064 type:complete len:130 (+) Transcript_22879:2-391(+)